MFLHHSEELVYDDIVYSLEDDEPFEAYCDLDEFFPEVCDELDVLIEKGLDA